MNCEWDAMPGGFTTGSLMKQRRLRKGEGWTSDLERTAVVIAYPSSESGNLDMQGLSYKFYKVRSTFTTSLLNDLYEYYRKCSPQG